jgi:hypothetical protein
MKVRRGGAGADVGRGPPSGRLISASRFRCGTSRQISNTRPDNGDSRPGGPAVAFSQHAIRPNLSGGDVILPQTRH